VRLDVDKHGNVSSRLIVEHRTLDMLRRDAAGWSAPAGCGPENIRQRSVLLLRDQNSTASRTIELEPAPRGSSSPTTTASLRLPPDKPMGAVGNAAASTSECEQIMVTSPFLPPTSTSTTASSTTTSSQTLNNFQTFLTL
jgi:hypothetical protein